MNEIVIVLPFPPSTNGLLRNVPGRGRVRTKRYQTWARAAGNELISQRASWNTKGIKGPVSVEINLGRPRVRRDIDNCAKAVLDLLVECRVIEDDSHVERLEIDWRGEDGALVTVRKAN